jgi:hypothetical protein
MSIKRLLYRVIPLAVVLAISSPSIADARAGKCLSCSRDTSGRIARDGGAVREFKRVNPKPPGCHRCEVDHIVPLHRGGADHPSNMQWLPRDVHQDKTRREAR